MIRTHNNRDVVMVYETLDYAAAANTIMLDGYKVVDLIFTQYTYVFNVEVEVWR